MQDLSALTRDWTHASCSAAVEAWSLNHGTTRQVPNTAFYINYDKNSLKHEKKFFFYKEFLLKKGDL